MLSLEQILNTFFWGPPAQNRSTFRNPSLTQIVFCNLANATNIFFFWWMFVLWRICPINSLKKCFGGVSTLLSIVYGVIKGTILCFHSLWQMCAKDQFLRMHNLLKAVAVLVCTVKTMETRKPLSSEFLVVFKVWFLTTLLECC